MVCNKGNVELLRFNNNSPASAIAKVADISRNRCGPSLKGSRRHLQPVPIVLISTGHLSGTTSNSWSREVQRDVVVLRGQEYFGS